jgi:hypothetical protein
MLAACSPGEQVSKHEARPVGICFRYAPDSNDRVGAAVVVAPSGDKQADSAAVDWILHAPPPVREISTKDWFGVWVGPSTSMGGPPDCAELNANGEHPGRIR